MTTEQPSGPPRPFAVPITEAFAQVVAEVLGAFRALANGQFAIDPAVEIAKSQFAREADELIALPEPVSSARQGLHGFLLHTGTTTWKNALDHLRALEHDVLMQPPPVWSPLTLSRVVMESSLLTQYLFDPGIGIKMRLARFAGIVSKDYEYVVRAGEAMDMGGPAQGEATAFHAELQRCQIQERIGRTGKVIGFGIDGQNAPLDINLTERAAKVLPSWLPAPYVITSGAAHGRPWVIQRGATLGEGTESGFVGEAATLMAATMIVMGALESTVTAWHDYFGITEGPALLKEMEVQRIAFLHRAAALAHPVVPPQRWKTG